MRPGEVAARRWLHAVERATVARATLRSGQILEQGEHRCGRIVGQRRAIDRARDADHGGDALRQFGVGREALEDVGRPLRVADQHQPLVRRQVHRHDRVFDLSAVIGAAGEAVHPDRGGLVPEAAQMFQGERKGAHEATEAFRAQPRHHGDAQLRSCRSQMDGLARASRLVGEAMQDLVAGPVLRSSWP